MKRLLALLLVMSFVLWGCEGSSSSGGDGTGGGGGGGGGGAGGLNNNTIVYWKGLAPQGELGGVYLINIDGTGDTHVPNTNLDTPGFEYVAKYTLLGLNGNRSKIIVSEENSATHAIHFLNPADGATTEIALYSGSNPHLISASITPDDSIIVYAYTPDGGTTLKLMKKTIGGAETDITPSIAGLKNIIRVAVSPDGTKIILDYQDTNYVEKLAIVNMDGTYNDIGAVPGAGYSFVWLDNSTIIFARTSTDSIATMDINGTNIQDIYTDANSGGFLFSLSPDRTQALVATFYPLQNSWSYSVLDIATGTATSAGLQIGYKNFVWGKDGAFY